MEVLTYEELIMKAQEAYEDGDKLRALDYFLQAEQWGDADLLIDIAILYDECENLEQAKRYYEKALTMDGDNERAYYGLGTVYEQRGQKEEALAHYLEAVALDPDYVAAHFFAANLYDELDQTTLAIYHYEQVLAINPVHFYALLNLGSVYELLNQNELALDFFLRAETINDQNHLLQFNFGVIYRKLGQIDLAIEYYQKSLQISTDYAYTFLNLAIIYKDDCKDLEHAIKIYDQGIHHHPDHAVLYYNRGCANALLHDYEAAIHDLSLASKLNPSLFEYLFEDDELIELRQTSLFQKSFSHI
jgi:tetratricopeptide (TPR) repeat protein